MEPQHFSVLSSEQVSLSDFLTRQSEEETSREIFCGLAAEQKRIPSRYFYDESGSLLFERITTLPEYYPTRTEKKILREKASFILESSMGGPEEPGGIVELGSGDCSKISILLDAVPDEKIPALHYFPVDVSESAILSSAATLAEKYPGMQIHGLLADFMKHLDEIPGESNRLICFFGSTIGNLSRREAVEFLRMLRGMMDPGDSLLVGFDMVKELPVLEAAYNDSAGITEEFNRNILRSVNHIAGTQFVPEYFRHRAFYNRSAMRIEMHLEADRDMEVTSNVFPHPIHLKKGETIHTENSHKFTGELIRQTAENAELVLSRVYTDEKGWFSLALMH